MRAVLAPLFAGVMLVTTGAAASPTRLPRSCRAAGLGPCFRAVDYSVDFDGSSDLVRDYEFDDDLGNHRQTHQEITTTWSLRLRGGADLYLRSRGQALPNHLRGILPRLPTGGRRSMTQRTLHSDDTHGGGTYTCAGHEAVAHTPSGFIRLDHLRPDGRGGYLLRAGSPWPYVLPDHRKITCRKWGNCLVSFGQGPSECEPIR